MKKIIKYLLFILLITTIALAATGKLYYYKALVYNFVDIDDLNLFYNREVKNGTGMPGMPWNVSTDYNKKNLSDTLTALLEANKSVAFLVLKNDSICFEKYSTLFVLKNIGKTTGRNHFPIHFLWQKVL